MIKNEYIISLESHADQVIKIIDSFLIECHSKRGFSILNEQLKLYEGEFQGTNFAPPEILIDDFAYEIRPSFNQFNG